MELRQLWLSKAMLAALERRGRDLNYTAPKTVYHCVEADYRDVYVGVFGDGANGSYEWFIWDGGTQTLRTSDCGYGCTGVALCDGLVESGAQKSAGAHDMVLAWVVDREVE
jgi:hypothetical protein